VGRTLGYLNAIQAKANDAMEMQLPMRLRWATVAHAKQSISPSLAIPASAIWSSYGILVFSAASNA